MLTTYVTGDWDPTVYYRAESFGREWNGWAVPIVTRGVLRDIIADSPGYAVTFDSAGTATVAYDGPDSDPQPEYAIIRPDSNGLYVCEFGWTFTRADDSDDDYARASIIDAMRVGLQGEAITGIDILIDRFPSLATAARVMHWQRADYRPACGAGRNVLTTGDAGLADCPECRAAFRRQFGADPV
jgi:hypothetical protein